MSAARLLTCPARRMASSVQACEPQDCAASRWTCGTAAVPSGARSAGYVKLLVCTLSTLKRCNKTPGECDGTGLVCEYSYSRQGDARRPAAHWVSPHVVLPVRCRQQHWRVAQCMASALLCPRKRWHPVWHDRRAVGVVQEQAPVAYASPAPECLGLGSSSDRPVRSGRSVYRFRLPEA
jgi:hypothetical protein